MARASAEFSGLDALSRIGSSSLLDQAEVALEDALDKGRSAMREAISTRGTGKNWEKPWGGRTGSYPGRVDSGDMLDDVDGKLLPRTPSTVSGQLGWENGSPFYYQLQEAGFTHTITGQDVEGMMALADAADIARRSLISDLQNIAKDI